MYESIFTTKFITLSLSISITFILSAIAFNKRTWVRGLLYNYAPAFSTAFYLTSLTTLEKINIADTLAVFTYELSTLFIFLYYINSLSHIVKTIDHISAKKIIWYSIFAQIALNLPLLQLDSFGIFSEESRIEYLFEHPIFKYLTYSSIAISAIQLPFLASLIFSGKYKLPTAISLLLSLLLSILSGSKGGFFLWFVSILALADYSNTRINKKIIYIFIIFTLALFTSSQIIANYMSLSLIEFFELAFNRFFLVNDGRALAFDFRNNIEANSTNLFVETFRSIANLFDTPPKNPPIGAHLYDLAFSIKNGSGANASLTSLIIFYSHSGYAALPCIVGILILILIFILSQIISKIMTTPVQKSISTSCFILIITMLSQDALGVQLTIPAVSLILAATIFLNDKNTRANK